MNKYRRLHEGTGDVQYDQKLTEDAQNWANHLAKLGKIEHSNIKQTGQGENLHGGGVSFSNCVKNCGTFSRESTCPEANKAW